MATLVYYMKKRESFSKTMPDAVMHRSNSKIEILVRVRRLCLHKHTIAVSDLGTLLEEDHIDDRVIREDLRTLITGITWATNPSTKMV